MTPTTAAPVALSTTERDPRGYVRHRWVALNTASLQSQATRQRRSRARWSRRRAGERSNRRMIPRFSSQPSTGPFRIPGGRALSQSRPRSADGRRPAPAAAQAAQVTRRAAHHRDAARSAAGRYPRVPPRSARHAHAVRKWAGERSAARTACQEGPELTHAGRGRRSLRRRRLPRRLDATPWGVLDAARAATRRGRDRPRLRAVRVAQTGPRGCMKVVAGLLALHTRDHWSR